MTHDEPAFVAKRRAQDRIVRHADQIIDALLDVVADKKAPAQSRVASGSTLLRSGGFFTVDEKAGGKEPYQMSQDELAAEIRRLEGELSSGRGDDAADDGLFD